MKKIMTENKLLTIQKTYDIEIAALMYKHTNLFLAQYKIYSN